MRTSENGPEIEKVPFFCLDPCCATSCLANVRSQHDASGRSHFLSCMLWKTSPSMCLACQGRSQVELGESQRHVNIVCSRGSRLQRRIEPLLIQSVSNCKKNVFFFLSRIARSSELKKQHCVFTPAWQRLKKVCYQLVCRRWK